MFLCTCQLLSVGALPLHPFRICTRRELFWGAHRHWDLSWEIGHPVIPQSYGVFSAFAPGFTVLRKLFLDFRRFLAGTLPYRGCRSSVDCRWRSLLLTAPRRIPGGALPDKMYIGVGPRGWSKASSDETASSVEQDQPCHHGRIFPTLDTHILQM